MTRLTAIWFLLCCFALTLQGQVSLTGVVTEQGNGDPVEFATVTLQPGEQWCMTDHQGVFTLRTQATGTALLRVTCVGYEPVEVTVGKNNAGDTLRLVMHPTNLQLQQVIVTAQRKTENATTSYLIDRQALDNQQIINVSDILTLLPGGKTVNSSLIND